MATLVAHILYLKSEYGFRKINIELNSSVFKELGYIQNEKLDSSSYDGGWEKVINDQKTVCIVYGRPLNRNIIIIRLDS